MMNQKMTDRHKQFLEDCMSQKLYLHYLNKKMRHAINFKEEELNTYHKAYVKLSSSLGDYSGCQLRINIKTIMESIKTQDEKYCSYKEAIEKETESYNAVYVLHPNKKIKL